MELRFSAPVERTGALEKEIGRSYRMAFTGPEGTVYQKGALSRYGVYIIHTSIILILLGGFVGTVFGYKGYMVLVKGEVKDRIVLRGENPVERPPGLCPEVQGF